MATTHPTTPSVEQGITVQDAIQFIEREQLAAAIAAQTFRNHPTLRAVHTRRAALFQIARDELLRGICSK